MLFYFNGEGKIIKTIPKPIYQGSNKANTIYFIAPVTATAKVNVSFILPNGFITKQNTMVAQGQMSGIEAPDNSLFNVWSFDIPAIVTAYSGAVTTQFFIIADKSIITTQTVKFAVSKGVSAILPQAPSQNIYNDILIALQNITEQVYSNTSGTLGLEYEVNVDGTATLIGYNGTSKDIIIPEWYIKNGIYYPVAKIENPFNSFFEIESVIIPESVNSIGEAFSNQKNLKTVVIPKNVVSLTGTFKDSLEIENIIFEGSLPTITDNVFLNTGANSKGLQVFVKPEFFNEFYNFLEVEKNFPLKVVTTITNIQINELQEQISGVFSAVQEQERINTQQTKNIQANAENIQELERITAFNTGNILLLQNAGYITKVVKDLENYYLKTETYSKEEINELHEQLTGLGIAFKTVDTLPEVGEEKFIYLLPSTVEENNVYEEYVWINKKWEKIGSTKVNLADYYNKEKIDEKFETVNQTIEQTAQDVENTYATKTSLDGKADISSVYTKSETDEKISDKIDNIKDSYLDKETYQANQKNVATKDEVKNKLDTSTASQTYATKSELTQKANTSDVYTKTEVDNQVTNLNNTITVNQEAINNLKNAGYITKAVSNLQNYYLKNETFSKQEILAMHEELAGLGIKFEVVQTLPTTGNNKTIYLLPAKDSQDQDIYDEYIYINSKWERIGSTKINLADYYNKSEIDNFNNNFTQGIQKNTQDITKINSAGFITKSVDDLLNYYSKSQADNRYVQPPIIKEINDSIGGIITNVNDINNILEERFDDVNLPDATQFTPNIIFGENGSVYVKTSSYNVELKDDGTLEVVSSTPETGRYVEILDEYENIPITSLAENIFANNSVLYGIELNKNITKIGSRAFYNCVGLITLGLNASITQIGDEVFANCTNLEEVEIGESVAVLGNKMFANCSNLKNITLPELITEIPNSAFSYTGLTEIVIPKNVTKIGQQAFVNCRDLISVTIGDSVTSIGYGAFSSCSSLTSIVIPNSVTSIGITAFNGCSSLTSIVIPDSVTSIGNSAFSYCSSLTVIVIPDSVTEISPSTFEGCSSLTEIVIPNSVTKIGEEAISFCNNLTNLTIPDSVTSIGGYAFQGCVNLTSVTIGNSVTSIGSFAFSGCSSLTSAKISEGVSLISQGLFFYCSNLQEVTIPSSVNEISPYAFEHCSNLKNIRIRATIPPLGGNHSSFNGISRDAIFRVPKGTLSRYQSSWSSLYNTYTFVEAND